MLILKQNAANTVPTPPAGKGTIFLDDSDTLSVKTSDGNVQTFPTVGAANAQVLFMNGTNISGESALTYDYNNNVLTVSGNVAATRVLTDNLLYANGTAWDLQQPGGSNTQIQFNDNDQFGGSAAFTFNKTSNTITASGNIGANNFNATTYVTAGNVYANSGIIGAQNLKGEGGNISNIQGANVSGTVGSATTAGTVTTAAQPNITSVGALTALDMGGHIIPTANATYDLGNSTNLFRDLYLSGQSIKLGAATISSNATAVTITNPVGGTMVVSGTGAASTSSIYNGNSNVSVAANSNVTISVTGNANVVTVTGTGVNVAGTLNTGSGVITGNGSGLSSLAGGNVSGQVGNALVAGTVYTNAQPNITSVGTLTSLAVTGNTTSGNVYANSGTVGASLLAGTLTTAAQPNITSVGTLSSLTVTGKVDAGQLQGDGGNISNVQGANVSGTVGSATTAGTVTTAAQPNITSVGTLTSASVTGNVTAGNVYANSGIIGAQNLKGEGGNISNIQGGNVSGTVSSATTAGTVTTAAQPNITSVGTLTSVSVSGNATVGNLIGPHANGNSNVNIPAANGNINLSAAGNANILVVTGTGVNVAGTLNTGSGIITGNGSGLSSLAGANVSGQVANATVAGTVYTAAQPNITSVGTLSSLVVSGNANVGNINPTNLVATGTGSFGGNLNMNTNYINNLGSPSLSSDAATKQYVDDLVSTGLYYHSAVNAATTGSLATATGGTMSYTAPGGAGNGVGAYLSTTGTFNLIDTVNVQTAGTRILVKNEANATWNGVYVYTNTTAITRSTDTDTYGPGSGDLSENDYFYVSGGNVNIGSAYICNTAGTITFGTTNINFAQFSSSQVYSNGVGLNLSGTQFSLANTAVTAASYGNGDRVASFTVDAQGRLTAASNTVIAANAGNLIGTTLNSSVVTSSLTAVGTVTTGVWNNNIGSSATFAAGLSGANLASITGGNVTGTVGSATTAGTVTTAAQPNITSVGTLTSLAVTGNITGGNANVTGQLISTVATGTAPLVVTSTTTVANLAAATAGTAGTVTTAAQPNITSVGTLTSLAVTGNVTVGNVIGPHANGNSNVNIPTANGNVNISAVGNITLVVTGTGANISGTLNATGNANVGNIGTAQVLASANVTAPQLISNVATGTAPLVVTSTTQVANLSVATAGSATTAGTVTTAAQPNITSVGTLTSLAVTGNTTSGNFIGVFANGNSNVNIPAANGNVNISAVGTANVVVVTGTGVNVAGTLNTGTGNANVGNIGTGTAIITTGNITTINSGLMQNGTSNVTIASGANVSIFTAGNATAQFVVTSTGANIAGTANVVGNANVGNLGTGGLIVATGNVTGGNVIATSYNFRSVQTAISAAGTAQGNATALTKEVNVVSTVASGAGVVLPTAVAGMEVKIINTAANSLLVYPASTGIINSLAANAAFTLGATSGMITFTAVSATQWYTGAATYS